MNTPQPLPVERIGPQPIKTAPTDGTKVLLWHDDEWVEGYYDQNPDIGWTLGYSGHGWKLTFADWWMPIAAMQPRDAISPIFDVSKLSTEELLEIEQSIQNHRGVIQVQPRDARALEVVEAENKALWDAIKRISDHAPKADNSCLHPGISLYEAVQKEVATARQYINEMKG